MHSSDKPAPYSYIPKSYSFPLERRDALSGYLEIALGTNVRQGELKTDYELLRLILERDSEQVTLTLHRNSVPNAFGRLTPQGKDSALKLAVHSALQSMRL